MSEPVELEFRQRVAAAFAADLAGRVYDLAIPPDAVTPLATYRRLPVLASMRGAKLARIQLMVIDDSYADAKRLQGRIERYMGNLRGTWLAEGGGECPVWVYAIRPVTMGDVFQGATRRRIAVSEFEILYSDRS